MTLGLGSAGASKAWTLPAGEAGSNWPAAGLVAARRPGELGLGRWRSAERTPGPARGWTVVLSLEWARTAHGKCVLGLTVTPTCPPWLWSPSDASGQPESRHSGHTLFTFYLVPVHLFLLCSVCANNSRTTADPELTRASPGPGPRQSRACRSPVLTVKTE